MRRGHYAQTFFEGAVRKPCVPLLDLMTHAWPFTTHTQSEEPDRMIIVAAVDPEYRSPLYPAGGTTWPVRRFFRAVGLGTFAVPA